MNNEENNIFDLNIKDILSDWNVWDALRELIANAIDESVITKTKFPIIDWNKESKILTIEDFGRGLNSNDFIQNENNEKKQTKGIIGKFGIGLKDAIAVLTNNKKSVVFQSKNGFFSPTSEIKKGMVEEIKTLHIQRDITNKIEFGTKIIIENISEEEYKKTLSNFLKLNDNIKLSSSEKGEVYLKKEIAEIYVNGMKISTDENFLFSYNIIEVNNKLNKSLNRERKNVSRDAFRDNVISILKSNINKSSQDLIDRLINTRDDYDKGEWSLIDVKKLVLKNSKRKLLVGSKDNLKNPAFESYALDKSYEVIWINSNDYKNLEKDGIYEKYTLNNFGNDFISNYNVEEVENSDLGNDELKNWDWVIKKTKELSIYWPEWKKISSSITFEKIKDHPNAIGLYSPEENKIKIVQKILHSKKELFNTIIHEIAHVISGESDATIKFENTLTSAYYHVLQLSQFD